jgi:hypothetical protein
MAIKRTDHQNKQYPEGLFQKMIEARGDLAWKAFFRSGIFFARSGKSGK